MNRARALGALLAASALLVACSSDGRQAVDDAASEASSLDTGVQAPPVPKDVAPTTTGADAGVSTTGATYYLAPKGDDAAAGTKSAPWASLETAAGKLEAGDTLLLQPGTYDGGTDDTGFFLDGLNGTADKPITIGAASSVKPKLVGGEWKTVAIENSSYVVLRSIETQGSALVDKKPTGGIEIRRSHHITVTDTYVHDGGGGGIGANESNHIDIIGNYVSGMAKWNPFQTSGISMFESREIGGAPGADGYSIRIVGNTVFGSENIALPNGGGSVVTDGNCIIIDSTSVKVYRGRTYIANNVCTNNGGRGIHVFKAGNVVAVNNTLYHNMQTAKLKEEGGELSAVESSDVVFRNNLVVPRADRKAVHDHKSDGSVFESNLYQGGSDLERDTKAATDRVVPDVSLTAPDGGDFTLRAGSVAIDAGSSTDAPALDQRGKKRTAKPDIGALEAAS